ncbi:HK97 gp10 family phage protein [Streptomyces sp. NBC_00338]|uniref:HK97 gp10 family phage protein n=1 Tax=Streptomyces sp. NBC_00338 TaxID=2975715 RepID=UPI00225AA184|nr:HK97 gp10 family phage protein [Streptomyces sp. NBC_00338]MCX5145086.1 HK97 gp10 family phage protein [Streptomyces sp. NBC_00338]
MNDIDLDEDAIRDLVFLPEVQADLEGRMDRVVEVGQITAPVLTGDYKKSIHRVKQPGPDGAVHVDASVDYAIYVEHGTTQRDNNGRAIHRPHYTLIHALDAAGGDH